MATVTLQVRPFLHAFSRVLALSTNLRLTRSYNATPINGYCHFTSEALFPRNFPAFWLYLRIYISPDVITQYQQSFFQPITAQQLMETRHQSTTESPLGLR